MAYPPPQPNDESRTLLRAIVILLAVIAACAVLGAGIWVFSWWQAQQALNQVMGDSPSEPDLTGTWTRIATGEDERAVELRITNDKPIKGSISVDLTSLGMKCTATWTESTRAYSTIHVDAEVTSGNCDNNEWEVTVTGNTMTASQTWSANGLPTPDLVLHREGG